MADIWRIGDRVKEARIAATLSQEELGERIGVKRQTIGKWETGSTYPDTENLEKLCGVFECDLAYLLGEIDTRRRVAADVSAVTGLSEPAIRHLAGMKHFASHERTIKYNRNSEAFDISDTPSTDMENSAFTRWLDTVNILLSEKTEGKSSTVLDLINEYLFFEFSGRRTITVCGAGCTDYVFDRERMVDLLLFEVMEALVKLREKSRMNEENSLSCEAEGGSTNGSD